MIPFAICLIRPECKQTFTFDVCDIQLRAFEPYLPSNGCYTPNWYDTRVPKAKCKMCSLSAECVSMFNGQAQRTPYAWCIRTPHAKFRMKKTLNKLRKNISIFLPFRALPFLFSAIVCLIYEKKYKIKKKVKKKYVNCAKQTLITQVFENNIIDISHENNRRINFCA